MNLNEDKVKEFDIKEIINERGELNIFTLEIANDEKLKKF